MTTKTKTLLSELRRLNDFPFKAYYVMGAGIYTIGIAQEFPVIRDPHASREALELICESLNWAVKKKAYLRVLDDFDEEKKS